jgi:hypothetical protein
VTPAPDFAPSDSLSNHTPAPTDQTSVSNQQSTDTEPHQHFQPTDADRLSVPMKFRSKTSPITRLPTLLITSLSLTSTIKHPRQHRANYQAEALSQPSTTRYSATSGSKTQASEAYLLRQRSSTTDLLQASYSHTSPFSCHIDRSLYTSIYHGSSPCDSNHNGMLLS